MSKVRRRISLFMESLGGGGAERVMLNLAQAFSRLEHHVDLVVASTKGPYCSQVPESVRLVDLGTIRTIAAIRPLARYLRRESPNALLSAMGHCNIVALLARKLSGTRARVVITEVSLLKTSTRSAPQFRSRWIPVFAKWFYPWADKIVAISGGVADDLSRLLDLPLESIEVIYNPVVTPELYEKAACALAHPWFKSGAPPVILGVGRLDPEKDFFTLLRAFNIVRRNRNVRLMILGEGPERFVLESLVQELGITDVVALPGFVENPLPFIARASETRAHVPLRRAFQCNHRSVGLRNTRCGYRLPLWPERNLGRGSLWKVSTCRKRGGSCYCGRRDAGKSSGPDVLKERC